MLNNCYYFYSLKHKLHIARELYTSENSHTRITSSQEWALVIVGKAQQELVCKLMESDVITASRDNEQGIKYESVMISVCMHFSPHVLALNSGQLFCPYYIGIATVYKCINEFWPQRSAESVWIKPLKQLRCDRFQWAFWRATEARQWCNGHGYKSTL